MSDFTLRFNTEPFEQLDKFALLVCQDYNLGNRSDWFGNFRGGLYGFYARLHGLTVLYEAVHAWLPTLRTPRETEYHLASIFFNLDSAVECLTFALNALGYAARPSAFRDISDEQALRQISPKDLSGDLLMIPPRLPLAGYKAIFPNVQALWQSERVLLDRIVEQHDVSKHRQTIYHGGRARDDPPSGFYQSLGIIDNIVAQTLCKPMAEILLQNDPKLPRELRPSVPPGSRVALETLAVEFVAFIQKTGVAALTDARTTILIPERDFRTPPPS